MRVSSGFHSLYRTESQHPSTYTETSLLTYVNGVNLKKKNNVSYNVTTSGLPSTGPATSNKSIGEKRYEAWTRRTPDKTKFDILKEDKHYNI